MSTNKAIGWVLFWFDLALSFCVAIFIILGSGKALEFISGYVIEQSLSIDNLFLFLVIFSNFGIKEEYQRRVLTFGIAGALVLRLIFIILGVKIVNSFHWLLYIFGIILMISGFRMMIKSDKKVDYKNSKIIRMIGRVFNITEDLDGDRFFVRKDKTLYITPLFVILILIELTDIIFALDSIPSVFSVSTDPFIVYTSNIFAILGLRNMYFVLGKVHEKFRLVKYGIAAILTFTGIKLSIMYFNIHISSGISLAIIVSLMVGSIVASVIFVGVNKKSG